MRIVIDRAWRVHAESTMELACSSKTAWGQMRDWRRFLTLDPLHKRLHVEGGPNDPARPKGQSITISHRLLGMGPDRVGRVLTWREERGYAISDLSRRGPRAGFPHICTYEVVPVLPTTCKLRVGVRGVWTARYIPRFMARAWIAWVLHMTEQRIRLEFELLDAARRTKASR